MPRALVLTARRRLGQRGKWGGASGLSDLLGQLSGEVPAGAALTRKAG